MNHVIAVQRWLSFCLASAMIVAKLVEGETQCGAISSNHSKPNQLIKICTKDGTGDCKLTVFLSFCNGDKPYQLPVLDILSGAGETCTTLKKLDGYKIVDGVDRYKLTSILINGTGKCKTTLTKITIREYKSEYEFRCRKNINCGLSNLEGKTLNVTKYGCLEKYFGKFCTKPCRCMGNRCDKHGKCTNELCLEGYTGVDCQEVCADGKFGVDCMYSCRCKDNQICDKTSGQCPSGICKAGFKDLDCQTDCVKGEYGENCNFTCNCKYKASCNKRTGVCKNKICNAGFKGLRCHTACNYDKFGENCYSTCHCRNKTPCDRVTGFCPKDTGCEAGFSGLQCQTVCEEGTFGENCKYTCNCKHVCNRTTGVCPNTKCKKGFRGSTCQTACGEHGCICQCMNKDECKIEIANVTCHSGCTLRFYGPSCDNTCPDERFVVDNNCTGVCHCVDNKKCNVINGTCNNTDCQHGYKGAHCQTPCDDGTFGFKCLNECHCQEEGECDKVNGACENGCQPGFRGFNCQSECINGTYGSNCVYKCNCLDNHTCDKRTGRCHQGCKDGFDGMACQKRVFNSFSKTIAIIITIVCIALIAFLACGFLYRKKRHKVVTKYLVPHRSRQRHPPMYPYPSASQETTETISVTSIKSCSVSGHGKKPQKKKIHRKKKHHSKIVKNNDSVVKTESVPEYGSVKEKRAKNKLKIPSESQSKQAVDPYAPKRFLSFNEIVQMKEFSIGAE